VSSANVVSYYFAVLLGVHIVLFLLDNDRFLYSFIKPKLQVITRVHMSDHALQASCICLLNTLILFI